MSEEHARGEGTATSPGRRTSGTQDVLDLDQLFDLLAKERRRYALYCLSDASPSWTTTSALVEEVAELERESAPDASRREGIELSMRHTHLPKLEEAGVVEYDREESTVEYRGSPRLEAWVERAADIELQVESP